MGFRRCGVSHTDNNSCRRVGLKTNAPWKTPKVSDRDGVYGGGGQGAGDFGTGTSRYKRAVRGHYYNTLYRKRISNKTHTRPSPHPMPPPFNSLTLNYSWKGVSRGKSVLYVMCICARALVSVCLCIPTHDFCCRGKKLIKNNKK